MYLESNTIEANRILITDDDPDERFALTRILKKAGYEIDQAASGTESIEKTKYFKPDILLLDVVMAGMDGFDVCRQIKSDKQFEEVSIVLVSNFSNSPEYKAKGLDAGADDFISRPFNSQEFLSRIKSLLRIKSIEKQLRMQQQWMQVTLSSIGDGLIATDDKQRIVFMNPVAESLTGWTRQDAAGQPFESVFKIFEDDTHEPVDSPIKAVLESGRIIQLKENVSLMKKDRQRLPIADSAAPIKKSDDEIIGGVLVFRDITQQYQSEEKLNQALQNWEALFKAIGQITLIVDPQYSILEVNDIALEQLGLSRSDIIGKKCYELFHGQDTPPANCPMSKTLRSKRQESGPIDISPIDGDFLISCTPVFSSQGEVEKIIHIATDITAVNEAQEERRKFEAHMRHTQKLEAIGTLAGGIAHDFNNILSSIIGFTELSMNEAQKGSVLEDNLQEVLTAGKRAKELVRQILTFARQTKERVTEVKIRPIIKEVLKFLRSSVPTTIDIKYSADTDACVQADATRIHQVLMNLCTNAVQAMEEKGGILRVDADLKTFENEILPTGEGPLQGDYIELAVSDTGIGIPEKIQKSIFEPYFTTKTAKEGTGLGLSTVHGIVTDCGGYIYVYSRPEEGSRFVIYLPAIHPPETQPRIPAKALPKGSETILLVDDELPVAKMGAQVLKQLGYDVCMHTDSTDALTAFTQAPGRFDMMITDMTMPGLTGQELAARIKEIRPDLPVILATGFSKKIKALKENTSEIDALCFKPVTQAELAQTVREVLDRKNR